MKGTEDPTSEARPPTSYDVTVAWERGDRPPLLTATVAGVAGGATDVKTAGELEGAVVDLVATLTGSDAETFTLRWRYASEAAGVFYEDVVRALFPETRELPCGCDQWMHEIFDGCLPPPGPRTCCGVLDTFDNDVVKSCACGLGREYFCVCGRFMGLGSGMVGCRCSERACWGRRDPEQRPRRAVPAGDRHHRRYRTRRGRR